MNTPMLEYNQILQILGNGDVVKGSNLLQKLAHGLSIARQKHGWGKGREIDDYYKASFALKDECHEWMWAMQNENDDRQFAEILDVMIVAARIANREGKKNKPKIFYNNY